MKRSLPLLLVVLALVAAVIGCNKRGGKRGGSAAATVCTKSFQRCRLPDHGPLGVCMPAPCAKGKKRPCFKCTPQH